LVLMVQETEMEVETSVDSRDHLVPGTPTQLQVVEGMVQALEDHQVLHLDTQVHLALEDQAQDLLCLIIMEHLEVDQTLAHLDLDLVLDQTMEHQALGPVQDPTMELQALALDPVQDQTMEHQALALDPVLDQTMEHLREEIPQSTEGVDNHCMREILVMKE